MVVLTVISVAIGAFLGGYLLGITDFFKKDPITIKKGNILFTDEQSEEYRNFLNYDGSEQKI